jgi:hypothetical protein
MCVCVCVCVCAARVRVCAHITRTFALCISTQRDACSTCCLDGDVGKERQRLFRLPERTRADLSASARSTVSRLRWKSLWWSAKRVWQRRRCQVSESVHLTLLLGFLHTIAVFYFFIQSLCSTFTLHFVVSLTFFCGKNAHLHTRMLHLQYICAASVLGFMPYHNSAERQKLLVCHNVLQVLVFTHL